MQGEYTFTYKLLTKLRVESHETVGDAAQFLQGIDQIPVTGIENRQPGVAF